MSNRVAADYQKYLGRTASLAEINGWVNGFLRFYDAIGLVLKCRAQLWVHISRIE